MMRQQAGIKQCIFIFVKFVRKNALTKFGNYSDDMLSRVKTFLDHKSRSPSIGDEQNSNTFNQRTGVKMETRPAMAKPGFSGVSLFRNLEGGVAAGYISGLHFQKCSKFSIFSH